MFYGSRWVPRARARARGRSPQSGYYESRHKTNSYEEEDIIHLDLQKEIVELGLEVHGRKRVPSYPRWAKGT